jgi:hypothetical protein
LRLPKTQLPPTRSEASKQPNSMPRSCSAFAAAMPEEPAPMIAAVGMSDMALGGAKVTDASLYCAAVAAPADQRTTRYVTCVTLGNSSLGARIAPEGSAVAW